MEKDFADMLIGKGADVTPTLLVEKHNAMGETLAAVMKGYDERLALTDGSLGEIKALVEDVAKEFKDRARRSFGEAVSSKLFELHNIEGDLSWDAVHKAPTRVVRKTGDPLISAERPESGDVVAMYQEKSDFVKLVAAKMGLVDNEGRYTAAAKQLKCYRALMAFTEKFADVLHKDGFQVGGATGSGVDWDPASFSTRMWLLARLPWKLATIIPSFTLPRSPFVFPVELADVTAYLVAEIGTAPPILGTTAGYIPDSKGTTVITGKKTFSAVKLAGMVMVSKESEEDLIVPIVPYAQDQLIRGYNNGKEKMILRGFKTRGGVSGLYDSDTTGATNAAKGVDGIMDYALNVTANTTKDAGGFSINTDALWKEHMRGARKLLDEEYMGDASELALVVSGNQAVDTGSCDAFRLWFATGGMSTNRDGNTTGYNPDGYANFVVSKFMRKDLASTGVNSGVPANDVFTAAVQFYPRAYLLGEERSLRVEVSRERFFEYDVDAVKMTWRGDMQVMLGGKHTAATINIQP